jgi:tripartite motif-containing protein 71
VHGFAFDNTGRMYVSDTDNHRIQVYTFTGGSPVYDTTLGVTDIPGNDNSHFDSPYRLAMDDNDWLYVVDRGNNRVQRCTLNGSWSCTTFDSGLNNPQGIVVDSNNNVYIADTENSHIRKCSSTGVCSNFIMDTYWLHNLAVDSGGNIYGAAAWNAFVVKYDNSGNELGGFV